MDEVEWDADSRKELFAQIIDRHHHHRCLYSPWRRTHEHLLHPQKQARVVAESFHPWYYYFRPTDDHTCGAFQASHGGFSASYHVSMDEPKSVGSSINLMDQYCAIPRCLRWKGRGEQHEETRLIAREKSVKWMISLTNQFRVECGRHDVNLLDSPKLNWNNFKSQLILLQTRLQIGSYLWISSPNSWESLALME